MNWGYRILFVIIGFLIFIFTLVGIALNQTNEMIDKNYYEKELKYQHKINGATNFAKNGGKIITQQNKENLKITLPSDLLNGSHEGYLELLRPNDQSKDLTFDFSTNSNGILEIPISMLLEGVYTLRTGWKKDGIDYYHESKVYIQ